MNMRNGKASEQVHFQQMYAAFHRKRQHVADHITELRATRHRDKRGLLGKIMTGVFGVNDEVYAELDLLQKHQITHILNHLRLNTVVERTQQEMIQRFTEMQQSIKKANKALHDLNVQTHVHTMIHHLTSAYTLANIYLDELSQKYDAVESALIGRGTIIDLIPLKRINSIIQNATDRLPIDFYV